MAVSLTYDAGVAVITLDRPEVANSIDTTFGEEFAAATSAVRADPGVRSVLLRAIGKNFCVGGDLKFFAGYGSEIGPELHALADRLHEGVLDLALLEVPLVVAVQGSAAGAGMSLALLGDVCLAARGAKFRVAYTAVGLTPDGGGSWTLPRLVGPRVAADLVLTNRVLDADEALRLGIVSRVVDDDQLDADAVALVRSLADGATEAFRRSKRLLAASASATLEEQLDAEARSIAAAATSPEGQEGIGSFVDKRRPKYHEQGEPEPAR
jgi:2-(1,2-epoxy-1,2-dihydrophenyl)acetyl-CoA isomerase